MKHLRKSILTLLALTLFGGAGAWAQEEVLLTTVTATGQTTYSQSPDGIVTVTLNNIEYYSGDYGWLWGGTVTVEAAQGYTITRCVFRQSVKTPLEDDQAPFTATMSDATVSVETSTGHVNGNANQMDGITSIEVYGYEGSPEPAEIELTKAGANQWSLGQTPDYDLELQVEYYEAHALKEIPAGWTVMVNGEPQEQPYQGDSLMITETDSVTLVPAGNPRRVKSVTLAEDVPPTITVTWNASDITGNEYGTTFTKDGVTITAGFIDFNDKNFMDGGTITTTLGNFTKIEVTATDASQLSGTGWSGSNTKKTWTGNASSVSFSGNIMGIVSMGNIQFVFTIQPTN